MNDERDGLRPDDVSDAELSALYRELASERTPASLNEAVLAHAARTAGRGYAHAIAWMRPLAWAATIGLCLAIVLELARVPQPDFGAAVTRPAAAPGNSYPREPAPREKPAYQVTEAPLLEEAAAIAKVRAESDGAAARPLAGASAGLPACSAEATAKPETWLECIEALREAGRTVEAEDEAARLAAAFPDFEMR